MTRNCKSLASFSIGATDGEIGKVKELYFDDVTWTIRYLIVETGSWLFGREVLISPHAVVQYDWENKIFEVNLTKEQVKNSPDIDTDRPVSRQQEILLNQYYPWPSYWGGGLWGNGMGVTGMMLPASLPFEQAIQKETQSENEDDNPHLRSTKTVEGYAVKATDGYIGDILDFLIEEDTMQIKFIVVDTGSWIPGKKVILSPTLINTIDYNNSEVLVNASIDKVKNSPEYDASKPAGDDYAASLESHYDGSILPH